MCSAGVFCQSCFPAETGMRLSKGGKFLALELTVPLATLVNRTAIWPLPSVNAPVPC